MNIFIYEGLDRRADGYAEKRERMTRSYMDVPEKQYKID